LRQSLPDAELVFTQGWMHELLSIHSGEELDCNSPRRASSARTP